MSLLSSFLDLIFPHRCTFCNSISTETICHKCADSVIIISPPLCDVCGIPFKSDAIKSHTCGECMKKRRHYSWARGVLVYDDATAKAIHRFKYGHDTTYSRPLGSMMADYPLEGFDLIIPVPLHIKRLRERGFNQSLLLANAIGKRQGIPVDPYILKRTRWTVPQVNLTGRERKVNVKGAFEVCGDVREKRILIVDDVYTTGATVSECSKVLKRSGAKEVRVLTLSRTAEL
jgi:ComF family protein